MKQRYENYEIEAVDDLNYKLSRIAIVREGTNAGKENLVTIGYFNQLEDAVRRIAKLEANNKSDLKEWLCEFKRTIQKLTDTLRGV